MKHYNNTQLKVSKEFWHEQLTNQIIDKTDSKVERIDGDKISIGSTNCTAEQDILKLSKQYPGNIFEAKYTTYDEFKNLATTYQYFNGNRKFVKEEYEYFFVTLISERKMLDPALYAKFENIAKNYFRKIDNYRVRTSENDPTFEDEPIEYDIREDDVIISPCIQYIDDGVTLTAYKYGLTYVDIRAEFSEENSKPENSEDEFTERKYDDVPF